MPIRRTGRISLHQLRPDNQDVIDRKLGWKNDITIRRLHHVNPTEEAYRSLTVSRRRIVKGARLAVESDRVFSWYLCLDETPRRRRSGDVSGSAPTCDPGRRSVVSIRRDRVTLQAAMAKRKRQNRPSCHSSRRKHIFAVYVFNRTVAGSGVTPAETVD